MRREELAPLTARQVEIKTRGRSTSYPRYTISQAEAMTRKVFDLGPRHCDQEQIAQALNYSNAYNGAYVAMRSTAAQFGMIQYEKGYVSVSEEWINAINSENDDLILFLRQKAMNAPELYSKLIEEYRNKQLPTLERLARELYINTRYGILKDAATNAAKVFLESADDARIIDAKRYIQLQSQREEIIQLNPENQNLDEKLPLGFHDNNRGVSLEYSSSQRSYPVNHSIPLSVELDRMEIQLNRGRKAYLFLPVPLTSSEKNRLKTYIDLVLEDDDSTSTTR